MAALASGRIDSQMDMLFFNDLRELPDNGLARVNLDLVNEVPIIAIPSLTDNKWTVR